MNGYFCSEVPFKFIHVDVEYIFLLLFFKARGYSIVMSYDDLAADRVLW